MSDYDQYPPGKRVLFIDENQCEIRGVVWKRDDRFADRLILIIKLDEGGYYGAWIRK